MLHCLLFQRLKNQANIIVLKYYISVFTLESNFPVDRITQATFVNCEICEIFYIIVKFIIKS